LLVAPLRNYAAWGILAWVMIRILGRKSSGVPVVMPSRTAIFYTTCMLLYFGILLLGKFIGSFH
ncbi:MAG: hypothetical protein ACKO7X_08475, partial [Bacteroidota bacterium]